MIFREAQKDDIKQLMEVRLAVKENTLSNPSLVTEADYYNYLFNRGKGWVCMVQDRVAGFSIVDLTEKNVWALFVHPDFAAKGIGKKLHDCMLHWYFGQEQDDIWLGTTPNTRAAKFYALQGWKETGLHGTKEIKFELSFKDWKIRQAGS
ncbi:MAG: family acetyltransferase [Ferruginibacter sp.]|uniref:GNAT family N-acetyltransferase n=1 Tax=Ferruginibacter sp. TaxID=1940288 RepID=UPI0026594236|nr:GNAT family N-acetyltransferase [Ferruginibacter sp.]MDB5277690.1 family acetyltransferase [Ferruginibacter sp.]